METADDIKRQIFADYANSLNPEVISLTTGQETPLMNIKDTHIVEVTDTPTGKLVLVSGSYYQINKYLSGIEGKHKHTKPTTINKYISNLYS